MLDKTSRFRKTLGGYNKKKKSSFDFPDAKPDLLVHIRQRAKKDHTKRLMVVIFLFVTIAVGVGFLLKHFNVI
ncbi:MAG: hypothetical protein GYB32_07875 [Algicola sp.]|nr:hypothetical protein [Algicola sp.]